MCLAGAVFNVQVPSSIPAGGKDFPSARKFNYIALCLGGHIKVRVPGATIARKNTCVIESQDLTLTLGSKLGCNFDY